MPRRGRQFGRSVGVRRKTSWNEGPGDINDRATVSATSVVIHGLGQVALQDGTTIIRLRGLISMTLTANASILDGFVGAYGICIVSEDAFAVGATAGQ